ncbi:MAG: TraR/DksA family transcriptional regulator [Patescibacteria group bacterium]|jgi:RNA polymerase-binding protein DksA
MKPTEQYIEKQKEAMLAEKERIAEQIKKLKKYPDYGDISDDNTQELTDFENSMAVDDQLEVVLKKINKALKSIDSGAYGKCAKCGDEIETGRLKIMPYADLCVTCQNNAKKER